jgi:hypothetical protein
MHIHDGEGTGSAVGITAEHRMKTVSIAATPEHHINHHDGLAFNLLFQITPTTDNPSSYDDAGICFLYMKNLSERDMVLEELDLRLGGTGEVEILELLANDGETPIGGVSTTPINLNLGSGNIAEGIFLTGTEITGMEQGSPLHRIYLESSHQTANFNLSQDFIITKNNTLTLWCKYGGVEIDGTIAFNYATVEQA